ncbi:unnamed protein product [Somion occarium]|uniref:Uncharacterized protein n=1 Tax=Somion occarium TaxID=3059160 RepID=A0ABP1DZ16_9APHY
MPAPSRRYAVNAPAQTPPPPIPPPALKRRIHVDQPSTSNHTARWSHRTLDARDVIADEDLAETQCETFSDNSVFSCFPTANSTIPQHQLASFVWNSNLPQFTRTSLVNIYLFDAASQTILHQWLRQPNPKGRAGVLRFPVNDTWFGPRGVNWRGTDLNYLFYWVVTGPDDDVRLQGLPQPIFTAVQTTFADSVAASMSSTSAAAASSAASVSSAIAASLSSAIAASLSSATAGPTTTSGVPNPSASIQSGNGGSSFPRWAIAVIVVLGALALLASGILIFFILRRIRNQRTDAASNRNSMGSASPMMANAHTGNTPQSPLLGGAAFAAGAGGSHRPTSPDVHDGASTMSRVSEAAPFSGADAAVMADAFRTALRKPNFADQPVEEGESPDEGDTHPKPTELINRELAEEGRDIRSVSSSRGVKVETLSDTDTVQDHPH